jgi:hypothetical protein
MSETIIRGVSCPSCAGSLELAEGTTLLNCEFCGAGLMVTGDRGIRRYYVPLRVSKEEILEKIHAWFRKFDKAPDLRKEAKITEMFPVFVPFWRVNAKVIGWVLGDVKKKTNNTTTYRPVERNVHENYEFTCPACDIGEFGVKWVDLKGDELRTFDLENVQSEGMTFGVMTTPTDVQAQCDQKFMEWAEKSAGVDRTTFSRLHKIGSTCNIVYYPLWVIRYEYKNRIYQITADAETANVLYGRAPGNNFYRVAWMIGSIFIADFILTSVLRGSSGDDVGGLIIGAIIVMAIGYRKFRHGGEVKIEQKDKMKSETLFQIVDQVKRSVMKR